MKKRRAILKKKSKEQANYKMANSGDVRCGTCRFMRVPKSCLLVRGTIEEENVCDYWKKGDG